MVESLIVTVHDGYFSDDFLEHLLTDLKHALVDKELSLPICDNAAASRQSSSLKTVEWFWTASASCRATLRKTLHSVVMAICIINNISRLETNKYT